MNYTKNYILVVVYTQRIDDPVFTSRVTLEIEIEQENNEVS